MPIDKLVPNVFGQVWFLPADNEHYSHALGVYASEATFRFTTCEVKEAVNDSASKE